VVTGNKWVTLPHLGYHKTLGITRKVAVMKLKDMFRSISAQSGCDILQAVSMVLDAEDISTAQRDTFICGYLAGLGYALYEGREGVEREILLRSLELGEEGSFSAL
jgi:hypothetical protein